MLSLSIENKISFTVNVQGTAVKPVVRVVIGESPALIFSAVEISNHIYESIIKLPETMKTGLCALKIEVLLNGRLFTPINTAVQINDIIDTKLSYNEVPQELLTPVLPNVIQNNYIVPENINVIPEINKSAQNKSTIKPTVPTAAKIKPENTKVSISLLEVANKQQVKSKEIIKEKTINVPPAIKKSKSIPLVITKGKIIYK